MIQMPQEHKFLPRELPILCKVVRFFIPAMFHTFNIFLIYSISLPVLTYLALPTPPPPPPPLSQQLVLIDPPDSAKQGTSKA